MQNRSCRRAVALCAAVALYTSRADADPAPSITKDQCVDANTHAQSLRRTDKLRAARELLESCVDPHCPTLVRDDCAARLDELERVQPSIIFDAKDRAGHDVSDVVLTMDGRPVADRLEGAALALDPGLHEFVFLVPGLPPVKQAFVLKEYEKSRRERIVLGPEETAPALAPPPFASSTGASAAPRSAEPHRRTPFWRMAGLVASGVGVAGIGAGSVFGLLAESASRDQKRECVSSSNCSSPTAAQHDHDTAVWESTVSTIAFVAGGALVVSGAVLVLVTPLRVPSWRGGASASNGGTPSSTLPWSPLELAPTLHASGGVLILRGSFD